MTKTRSWSVENLDCASCANELEHTLSLRDGVASASMNYLAKKLTVESAKAEDDHFWSGIEAAARRAEPTVSLTAIASVARERIYSFSGLDCPSCALEVESHLAKGAGVASARVDYASGTIRITSERAEDEGFFAHLIESAKAIEPSLKVRAFQPQGERSPSCRPASTES